MCRLISIAQASEMLGVTAKTLKIWTNEDKIKCYRTAGGHRRFRIEDIEEKEKLEHNEEMVKDLISIVTCFSARLYGAKGVKKLKKVIAELEVERGGNIESNNKSNAN